MDTKLRCTFEMPAGADSGNQNDLNASEDGKVTRAKSEDSYAAKSQKVFNSIVCVIISFDQEISPQGSTDKSPNLIKFNEQTLHCFFDCVYCKNAKSFRIVF